METRAKVTHENRQIGKVALIGLCVIALAGALALVGCGGGDASSQFVGSWTFEGGSLEGQSSNSYLESMTNSLYKDATLEVKQDGTAKLTAAGMTVEGTWKIQDGGMQISASGTEMSCSIESGKLVALSESSGTTFKLVWSKS